MTTCTHLDQVAVTQLLESVEGCQECLRIGDPWLHDFAMLIAQVHGETGIPPSPRGG